MAAGVQAVFVALFVGNTAGTVLVMLGLELRWAVLWGWLTGSLVGLGYLLYSVETYWRVELGLAAGGRGAQELFRVAVSSNEGRTIQFVDFPVEAERLRVFAADVSAGGRLAQARWTGTRGIFSRSEYQLVIERMLARGWIVEHSPGNPQQGYVVTTAGRHVLRRFSSPTPGRDGRARG